MSLLEAEKGHIVVLGQVTVVCVGTVKISPQLQLQGLRLLNVQSYLATRPLQSDRRFHIIAGTERYWIQ